MLQICHEQAFDYPCPDPYAHSLRPYSYSSSEQPKRDPCHPRAAGRHLYPNYPTDPNRHKRT